MVTTIRRSRSPASSSAAGIIAPTDKKKEDYDAFTSSDQHDHDHYSAQPPASERRRRRRRRIATTSRWWIMLTTSFAVIMVLTLSSALLRVPTARLIPSWRTLVLGGGAGGGDSYRCFDWDNNTKNNYVDNWWTHNPEWMLSLENDTHQCFTVIQNIEKRNLFRRLYHIQFEIDCKQSTTTHEMWSTGWGADFHHLNDRLLHALNKSRPVPIWGGPDGWHYAAKKDGTRPVCPARDLSCYFLNISSCPPNPLDVKEGPHSNGFLNEGWRSMITAGGDIPIWLYEYATRTQTWLRRATYDFAKTVPLLQNNNNNNKSSCTVMHVRRADVVLHQQWSRKYHPIREYVEAGIGIEEEEGGRNILLLTDDENAINEAHTEFPNLHWVHIDRPRYKGADGGWEGHIPSDDPKLETIVILSIFRRLVPQCTKLIHSTSNFADYMFLEMPEGSVRINIDDGKDGIYSEGNTATAKNITSST